MYAGDADEIAMSPAEVEAQHMKSRSSYALAVVVVGLISTIQHVNAAPRPRSPLDGFFEAVNKDDVRQIQVLLDEDPSLATSERKSDGLTALHCVRSAKVAGLLLDQGADLFARDRKAQATPLRWAAYRFEDASTSNPEVVRYLQSKGASEPDIFFATAVGDVDRVKLLLSQDPKLATTKGDRRDLLAEGSVPLHLAAYCGQLAVAKLLIEHGADVNDRGGWHNTEALEKAAWTGRADVVTLLLDHGAKIDGTASNYGDSPLFNAATAGRADVVKVLIDRGATVKPSLIPAVMTAMKDPDVAQDPVQVANFRRVLEILKPR